MTRKKWFALGTTLTGLTLVATAVAVLSSGQKARATPAAPKEDKLVSTKSDNPKVAPGKVVWHADLAAAEAAAKKSGKPVLLFQMMGRLDHKFC
jgi:hypothetical protein